MLTFNTVNRQTVIISNSVCMNTSREWGVIGEGTQEGT